MTLRHIWFFIPLCLPCLAAGDPAAAPDPAPQVAPVVLTEEEAVSRALKNSHEALVLDGMVSAHEKMLEWVPHDVKNPEVRIRGISTKYFDPNANKELNVGLRWEPPKIGQLGEKEQAERVILWDKKVRAGRFRIELVARTRKAYARFAVFQDYAELAAKHITLEAKRLEAVDELVKLGQRPFMNRVAARKRYLKARKDAAAALQQFEDAQKMLSSLTGLPEGSRADKYSPPLFSVDIDRLHEVAAVNRAEIEYNRQQSEMVKHKYKYERYKLIPWFTFVELDYHYESQKPDFGELKLGIELPLFNYNTGNLAATKIARNLIEDSKAKTAEEIDRDLREALHAYEKAKAEYMAVTVENDRPAIPADKVMMEAEREGLMKDDILEIELADIELRETQLKAGLDVTEAAVELCLAAGVDGWDKLPR